MRLTETTMPTRAPMTNVRTRKTCSSRSRKNAFHCCDGASLHVFRLAHRHSSFSGFLFNLESLSGFVRYLRRGRRSRLIFHFAGGQEKPQTQHLFATAL